MIEFFQVDDTLIVNEMAPRVHNTGHWTIEGAVCSQFENHLRSVAGLPLGSSKSITLCQMVNIIGKMRPIEEYLKIANLCLHDYGKAPREGRKLGHYTLIQRPLDGEIAHGRDSLSTHSREHSGE